MSEFTQLAISLPKGIASELRRILEEKSTHKNIEMKEFSSTESDLAELSFDPIVAEMLVWVGLKLVDEQGVNLVVGTLAGLIAARLDRKMTSAPPDPEVDIAVKFPDGTSVRIPFHEGINEDKLKDILLKKRENEI